ncbi:MAG: hypothetical protein BWY82_01937 [Verrucomicrobia bacterium ADurb.Bin474]|nr:MAG: hypothetical protein BWY82_01937 [Verrucomicrobia bacterium ADurb.Bin474]
MQPEFIEILLLHFEEFRLNLHLSRFIVSPQYAPHTLQIAGSLSGDQLGAIKSKTRTPDSDEIHARPLKKAFQCCLLLTDISSTLAGAAPAIFKWV